MMEIIYFFITLALMISAVAAGAWFGKRDERRRWTDAAFDKGKIEANGMLYSVTWWGRI